MMTGNKIFLLAALAAATASPLRAESFSLPPDTRQVILGLSPGWNDSTARLQRWEKKDSAWQPVGAAIPVRLGKNGLAWGRGIHPAGLPGPAKKESDNRAPAGVFTLGDAYGYAPDVSRKPSLTYHQVTASDLWVEDPASPDYNKHLRLPPWRSPSTDWEKKQQMKQDDPAHSLKLFINHNAGNQIRPGAGSAIFFHIWREDGTKPSTGCTVMPEAGLKELIAWTDPAQKPLYILLPESVYLEKKNAWKLP